MKIKQLLSALILLLIPLLASAQSLSPEDIQDFDEETGMGCIEKNPVSEQADYYVICKSNKLHRSGRLTAARY